MKRYTVTGMSCAACSARVEKAVRAVEGVTECTVNLLTNSMTVDGTASDRAIVRAVSDAGYGATEQTEEITRSKRENGQKADDTSSLKLRLITSLILLAVLMYLSMGHVMCNLPLPSFLAENPMNLGLCQLLLAGAVMIANQKFFRNGVKGLLHRAPNMDTLVSLGSFASFAYSVSVLFALSAAQKNGAHGLAHAYLHDLYFESAAMILTLITVGKLLEARAKGKTTSALEGLMRLAPKTATVLRNGKETVVTVEEIRKGDLFLLRPGDQIPVDGTVLEGQSAVNESALTGESLAVDKEVGDRVSSGTLNESGVLKCRADRVGEDTTLAQIVRTVSDAAATKAPIAKTADKVSGIFVPAVLLISLVTLILWLTVGAQNAGFAVARAVSVLVVSCPCALGLATPVAIMVGTGKGAKNGILFKTATALEQAGKTVVVALDKTGTVTEGNPTVVQILPEAPFTEKALLSLAVSLEQNSEHPLARAICKKAEEEGVSPDAVSDFSILPGSGLTAVRDGAVLLGGSLRFIERTASLPDSVRKQAQTLAEDGKTPLFFCSDGKLAGMIAVADVIKKDAVDAIRSLKELGVRIVLLTGDNRRTALAIARRVGIDEVVSDLLPDGKRDAIRDLQKDGRVTMVGDGINDAPALTQADVGIAIGAGTDIAIDAADVVLVKSRLSDVPAALRLSRATLRNIKQNLFWAFFYNAVGIPLAAGVWYPLLGWKLSPMFGAAAMSLSSVCVVTNALRLNFARIRGTDTDKKNESEEPIMKKTMKIKGMMCGHCEARVKQGLSALPAVESADVSHKKNRAVLTLREPIEDEVLKRTVEEMGYKVLDIQS